MIITTWSQFRWWFAVKGRPAAPISVTFTADHNIHRTSGSFLTEGVESGHGIYFTGTTNNNVRYTVDTVDATDIYTIEDVTTEGPVSCDYISAYYDPDGLERWPLDLVRSGGFAALTGVPTPYVLTAFRVTANANAADAVPGTDEYDWYLSRRTDDSAKQLVNMIVWPASGGNTYSGSVALGHSNLSLTEVGFSGLSDFTPDMIPVLFKYCHLYCRRRSDGAIQWIDLLRAMTASV